MAAKLIALVLPLGLDTLAVAAALGIAGIDRRRRRRVSLLFVAFEAGMPLVGVAAGVPLAHTIGGAADYIAVGVLLTFGLHTLLGDGDDDEKHLTLLATAKGPAMLLLGLSISLDELVIGFSIGLLRLPVALVIVLIAAQTLVVTQIGLRAGNRLGRRVREGAERLVRASLTMLAAILLAERLLN